MICKDIWDQHEMRFSAAGCSLRFLRYKDHSRATASAGLTAEDLSFYQRLQLKRKVGVEAVTPTEEVREREIMERWPIMDTYAACFVRPQFDDGDGLRTFLASLPRDDRLTLEMWLEKLTDPMPQGVYGTQDLPVLGALGMQISRTIDYSTVTLQQAMVLFGSLAAAVEAQKQEG